MDKTVSFTVKMSKQVKESLNEMCRAGGFKINRFIEKAVMREIERETVKEDLLVHEEYRKYGKKTLSDFDQFVKGLKSKK